MLIHVVTEPVRNTGRSGHVASTPKSHGKEIKKLVLTLKGKENLQREINLWEKGWKIRHEKEMHSYFSFLQQIAPY